MGQFFLMSRRFNKQTYEDFDLVRTMEKDVFARPCDETCWRFRLLYDFGWGKENGFYRVPMLGFDELIKLVLHSKQEEDQYGAAAVILDDYGDALLNRCQEIINDEKNIKAYLVFFRMLKLDAPINRSSIIGKRDSQIADDFNKWKAVAKKVSERYGN